MQSCMPSPRFYEPLIVPRASPSDNCTCADSVCKATWYSIIPTSHSVNKNKKNYSWKVDLESHKNWTDTALATIAPHSQDSCTSCQSVSFYTSRPPSISVWWMTEWLALSPAASVRSMGTVQNSINTLVHMLTWAYLCGQINWMATSLMWFRITAIQHFTLCRLVYLKLEQVHITHAARVLCL